MTCKAMTNPASRNFANIRPRFLFGTNHHACTTLYAILRQFSSHGSETGNRPASFLFSRSTLWRIC